MAVEPLPEHLKDAGASLLSQLDTAGIEPSGVLWLHFYHLNDWRLTVVTDLVDHLGRVKTYKLVDKALSKVGASEDLTMLDIHLASPAEIMPRVLGGTLRVERGPAELVDCMINDRPVDALIYRLVPPRPEAEAKVAARKLERAIERLPQHA